MNLIFMYGPPASGKLTVATALSELTGYSLFHNHLSRDLVEDIYHDDLMAHYELVNSLRHDVLAYCSQHQTNLIFTYVYDGPDDNTTVRDLVRSVTDNGGHVRFVELTAARSVLLDRVANASRKKHQKLVDRAVLTELLETTSYPPIPYDDVFKLDTSIIDPQTAAHQIRRHFNLV
ncbi:MAG: AAA family ATPase [Candidatus Saccharibacteria bacterium]